MYTYPSEKAGASSRFRKLLTFTVISAFPLTVCASVLYFEVYSYSFTEKFKLCHYVYITHKASRLTTGAVHTGNNDTKIHTKYL